MKRGIFSIFLIGVIGLVFLIPSQIDAWWPLGPKTSNDCILKYQGEAKSLSVNNKYLTKSD